MIDRRRFVATLPAAAVAGRRLAGAYEVRLDRFGVQLYTLRSLMAEAPERTLAAVAEAGYAEVELAGLYGHTPARMRAMLDDVGLGAASSHQSLDDVRGGWSAVLDGARELGQDMVVIAGLPGGENTPDGLRRVAEDFDRAAAEARSAGLRFGYHNHAWELAPLSDGTRPIDVLLDHTDATLVDWQMDIFWAVDGGGDPLTLLRERAGRVRSVHVKDRTADGRMVAAGDGVIDFGAILSAAGSQGLLHAFVEHDRPGDPVESIRRSIAHLRTLGP